MLHFSYLMSQACRLSVQYLGLVIPKVMFNRIILSKALMCKMYNFYVKMFTKPKWHKNRRGKALVQVEKASYKGNRQKKIYFNFVNQKFPNIFKSASVSI